MTCHYPDLGSASDWSCRLENFIQPMRSTTQIWVVTRHQYGISALVSQMSFGGESGGSVAKCRLFSQAKSNEEAEELTQSLLVGTSTVIFLFGAFFMIRSQVTDSIDGNVRGTQRLFSVKYLFKEANIV